ncbi:MAG: hypothetical protein RL769_630, partial [Pseudomonadota bacterium]
KHEPNKTDNKLPFILQLVEQPQLVYDHQFQQQYNAEIGSQSIPNPTRSSSDLNKDDLIRLRSEIFERTKNQDLSSPEIQEKFQKLKEGFFCAYRSKLEPMGIRRAERMFSPENISKKLDFIGELIVDPKKANDDELIKRYDLWVYGRRGPDNQTRDEARGLPHYLQEVVDVVGSLQKKGNQTPSPSPRPVSCFSFKGLCEFGGVRSQGERSEGGKRRSESGRRSGGNSQAFGRRLFGAPRTLGQSSGR